MKLLDQGRKYALTAIFLALSAGLMVASYVLALASKLSSEWVTLCTVVLPTWTAATIGFQITNTMNTKSAIEAGVAPTPPGPEAG